MAPSQRAGEVKTHLGITEVIKTTLWLVVPTLLAMTKIGFVMCFSCVHGDFPLVKSAFFLVLSLHMNGLYLELVSMLQSLLHPDTQHRTHPGLAVCPEAVHVWVVLIGFELLKVKDIITEGSF